VITGLERNDLFCVVIEQFMTDTARYADLVLPATTQLEHLDLAPAWGHLNLALNRPAIDPVGQALSNTEIFRRLAVAMNLEDPILAMSDEDLVRLLLESDHPFLEGLTYGRLWEEGWARLTVPSGHRPYVDDAPQTVDGRLQLGSLTYRAGRETPEGDPDHALRFPLTLISLKQHVKFLNSSYGGFDKHFPSMGEPRLEMDPADAERRSLSSGDRVDIFNDRGSLTMTLAISDRLQPGLVAMPFGWWNTKTPNGRGVNALTNPEVGPDDIGSAAFHETLVEVHRHHDGHVAERPE
jgi:anaerobic selenocysteine-containing dehydrogenase